MSSFNIERKGDQGYLDCAANMNGGEKASGMIMAMRRLHQRGQSDIDIVEVGPGGGAALDAITSEYKKKADFLPDNLSITFVELDGIESDSLGQARDRFKDYGDSRMICGDAKSLSSVITEGADIVAASAVLHEVYSYGGGYDGIDQTLSQITTTLREGGYFAYRDVYAVDEDCQHERKLHIYDKESWICFAKLFLPHYLDNAVHPYHREDDKVVFHQDSKRVAAENINTQKYLSINAPVGVLRELQRHYITFRDYCWREGILGFTPELEGSKASDWLDIKKGSKRVHYKRSAFTEGDILMHGMSEEVSDQQYVVDGDIFDQTSDGEIGRLLNSIIEGDEAGTRVWEEWISREGLETYVYMNIDRFLGSTALRSLEASGGKKILLPENSNDIKVIDRRYYNRYLSRQLSNPLRDAKQLALLRLYDTREDKSQIEQSLDILNQQCSRSTIARVYNPIRKAVR